MDFAARLQQFLNERNWTAYKLSTESGISIKTIYQWLNGEFMPSVRNLVVICETLHITMAEFFSDGNLIEATDELKELYQAWRALSKEKQAAIRTLLDLE